MIWRYIINIVCLLAVLVLGSVFVYNMDNGSCNVDPSDPKMAQYLPGTIVLEPCPPKISDYMIPVVLFLLTLVVGWMTIKKHAWFSVVFPLSMVAVSVVLLMMTMGQHM